MNAPNGVEYHISGADGVETVSVYVPGKGLNQAFSTNPNYEKILELARQGDHSVMDLFDLSLSVQKQIEKYQDYTDRVSVANGRVFFDRTAIDNSLTTYILRLLEAEENFLPWMRFMEKLQDNPQPESREMLFDFLQAAGVTLTPDGDLVCYKGVQNKNNEYHSLNTGTAIVNGVTVTGTIPYPIGGVVEMPREEVAFDPNNACSTGLHVATRSFAETYGTSGVVLEVHVHPRDVVSVPYDASGQKVRVSRLKVVGINEKRIEEPVHYGADWTGWDRTSYEDHDHDFNCGCEDDEDDIDWGDEDEFTGSGHMPDWDDDLGSWGKSETDTFPPPTPNQREIHKDEYQPPERKGGLFGKLFKKD